MCKNDELAPLPGLAPRLVDASSFGSEVRSVEREDLMRYGYFDNENREYVITRPDTPTPWMNYLGKGKFSGIISNTAGGLCFDGDPSNRRVLRYRFDAPPKDRPGRYLYIRNEDTGDYWSPTWQPVMRPLRSYECRHGLGYTRITGTCDSVETTITYCVPLGKNYELWQVTMRNLSSEPKRLKLFSYVEFSWNDAKWDMLAHWPSMALVADFCGNKIVVDTVAQQLTGQPMYDYIATDLDIDGYDCSLDAFLGDYRSESNPVVVERGQCTNSSMHSSNCVGVLSSSIVLEPHETKCFNYTLGATSDRAAIDAQIEDAFSRATLDNCISDIKADWVEHCSHLVVDTPCQDMNTMLNIWHAYQARTTFDWSRFISFYERGVNRGFGFRDSMQDVLGVMHSVPQSAKERIELLLSIQRSDGNARAVYYPATGEAVGGDRSDDHLWSVFSVCNYVKETGDTGFIYETVPFIDGSEGSVLEHLERGIDFTMANLGPHGMPKMLRGDWNDSIAPMNLQGKGNAESTFVFFQLAHAAYELLELYKHLGLSDRVPKMQRVYDYCRSKVDSIWDGEWFIRAYTTDGEKYGTKDDEFNKIYLNPQSWSVLSRLPNSEKANKAMDSVMRYLYTDMGLTMLYPALSGFDLEKKAYYLFAAGARENGGIFFHSNAWAIIALAMLGRSDDAFACYESALPTRRNDIADICLTEPYVYSQTMIAKPHDRAGACVNSWLTGTASWTFLAATQYILGIRPEYDGLCIDPKIPSTWDGFRATRKCRGVTCHVTVERDGGTGLSVNSVGLGGNVVPWTLFREGTTLDIHLGIR
jgi:cellobiose phosphorylase